MVLERPLPQTAEAPVRERLRWEKELLGLYLSEHPMGEVADQVGAFVTAYSGDLKSDETLDGQRLVVGGIVVASRTVVTRTRSTMSVVTLEDLQGSIEVVVFPRLYETTGPIWQDGAILLVAGRVDHRGEEVSLLADVVVPWDEAVAKGADAFAREVAQGDRGAPRRRQPVPVGPGGPGAPVRTAPTNGNGNGYGTNHGAANGHGAGMAPGTAPFDPRTVGLGRRPEIPYVSPLRGGVIPDGGPLELVNAAVSTLPRIAPAEPLSTYEDLQGSTPSPERDAEPALPDEARARVAADAEAATAAVEAAPLGSILHVRFATVPASQLVAAMEAIRGLVRERPGETRVVVHVPAVGGGVLPMELRAGIAYDTDLLAEVQRRLGQGIVQLSVAPPA
jgi:hypothetical protein